MMVSLIVRFKMKTNWWRYTFNYFSPVLALPFILAFALGNSSLTLSILERPFDYIRLIVACLLATSFYYRFSLFTALRELDEPHLSSPIEEGLLDKSEAKKVAFSLIGFEIFLTLFMGFASFITHLIPITYSLIIYRHFFCKEWLCRRPVLYALMRSLVFAFVGFSVGVTVSEKMVWTFPLAFYAMAIVNWAAMNLQEFTKKAQKNLALIQIAIIVVILSLITWDPLFLIMGVVAPLIRLRYAETIYWLIVVYLLLINV